MTDVDKYRAVILCISTHTPLAGRDNREAAENCRLLRFLLTRPLRDVTLRSLREDVTRSFLLTRPLRDVTAAPRYPAVAAPISTHTPLAGRDITGWMKSRIAGNFYSHAPCGT